MVFLETRTAEERNTWPYEMQFAEPINELLENMEYGLGLFPTRTWSAEKAEVDPRTIDVILRHGREGSCVFHNHCVVITLPFPTMIVLEH